MPLLQQLHCDQRIRGYIEMRHINLRFTDLLPYLLTNV